MPPKTKKKIVTGFCANKQCEGTKPVSPSGAPMKTCEFWETCGCPCHAQLTEMYRIAEMDRPEPEQTPEYLAWVREQLHQFVVPSPFELPPVDGLSSPGGTLPPPDPQQPVTAPPRGDTGGLSSGPHGTVEPVFTSTPTGRRARGQLEYDVLKVCDDFMHDVYDVELCTPKFVAERIGKMHAEEPPSTGAINAVWDRWEKLEFATQAKKPSRFTGFVVNGDVRTLEMMKAKVKRNKKLVKAEIRRGIPRPRAR